MYLRFCVVGSWAYEGVLARGVLYRKKMIMMMMMAMREREEEEEEKEV